MTTEITGNAQEQTKLLESILAEMQRQNRADALWDKDDIAHYLGLGKSALSKYMKDLPAPVILPTGGKRWIPKHIKEWAERRRTLS